MTASQISGEVGRITVSISLYPDHDFPPDADEYGDGLDAERQLYFTESQVISSLRERRAELEKSIKASVRKDLGPHVSMDPVVIRHGSIEIIVVLSVALMAVKQFNEVVDNLQHAAENVRRICRGVVGHMAGPEALAESRVDLGPALVSAVESPGPRATQITRDQLFIIVVPAYMVLAALLTVLAGMVLQR